MLGAGRTPGDSGCLYSLGANAGPREVSKQPLG